MRSTVSVFVAALIGVATTIGAQTSNDAAARVALALTPVGALPPLITSTIQGEAQHGAALALRYGYLSGTRALPDLNNFGATAILPFGFGSTISLTGGVFSCDGCDTGLMLSVGADKALGDTPLGSGREGSRLRFALNGELGYGQPQHATFSSGSVISGYVGLPISLVSGSRARDEMRIVPFVTPGFGFGGVRGDNSASGTALMIGGGVGIHNRSSSVALSFGFQHVAIEESGTQIGLALVIGGR